jgi:hypothetical protein
LTLPVQVSSESGGREGHFTFDTETDFRLYFASTCSGVTQNSHAALHHNTPQAVVFLTISSNNKENVIPKAERDSRPYFTSSYSGLTQKQHVELPSHWPQAVQDWNKSDSIVLGDTDEELLGPQELKCPSLPTDLNLPCTACNECAESAMWFTSVTPLLYEGRYGRKIVSPSKVTCP